MKARLAASNISGMKLNRDGYVRPESGLDLVKHIANAPYLTFVNGYAANNEMVLVIFVIPAIVIARFVQVYEIHMRTSTQ